MPLLTTGNQLKGKTFDKAIVFVHGLNGSKDTWVGATQRYIERMKADKDIYDNFALYIFEYPTKIVEVSFLKKIISIIPGIGMDKKKFNSCIRIIAGELIGEIRVKLKDYKDIILVTHSMGGLVAKKAMTDMNADQRRKVKLYYSISVPHLGSALARAGFALTGWKNPQLMNLTTFSEFTTELTQNYADREYLPKTFYHWGSQDKIVKEASAIPASVQGIFIIKSQFDHYNVLLIPNPETHTVFLSLRDELAIILLLSKQQSLSNSANKIVNFSILDNWSFKQSAKGIASSANCTIEFIGFSPEELSTPLSGQNLTKANSFQALEALKFTGKQVVPNYKVEISDTHFIITKIL